jgi:hypothetical protein
MIKIHYNGRRFPRVVSLRGGGKISFLPNRLILDLEEYDALYLLKLNNRLTPEKWEFTVIGVENQESLAPIIKEPEKIVEKIPEKKQEKIPDKIIIKKHKGGKR